MKTHPLLDSSSPAAPLVAISGTAGAAHPGAVDELIARITNPDDTVRGPAWQGAGRCGAPAVKPLADLMAHPEVETSRAAIGALWRIVREAGRPGAVAERAAVATELIGLLTQGHNLPRREVLWMLSEIGGDEAVPPVAALLFNKGLREDARAALQRIPGERSLAALQSALAKVPEDYRPAIAVSVRARGVAVTGYPSRKLVPTKQTTVKAISAV